jgi:hypothetical protein
VGEPGPRYALSLVLDSRQGRLLMFGGETNRFADGKFAGFQMHDDLWAWDLKAGKWSKVEPKNAGPARRAYYAACFDPDRNGVWLHGGFSAAGKTINDLWFYDCAANEWLEVKSGGDEKPSPRDGHSMFYDPKGKQLVLFGGLNDFQTMAVNDELWVFDPAKSAWTARHPKNAPAGRFLAPSAFDPKTGRMFVVSGFGGRGVQLDNTAHVYSVADDAWTSMPAPANMKSLAAGQAAFIPQAGRLVMFGGGGTHREVYLDIKTGVWAFAATESPAPGRSYQAMAFDPGDGAVYVYGGTKLAFLDECLPANLWKAVLTAP